MSVMYYIDLTIDHFVFVFLFETMSIARGTVCALDGWDWESLCCYFYLI